MIPDGVFWGYIRFPPARDRVVDNLATRQGNPEITGSAPSASVSSSSVLGSTWDSLSNCPWRLFSVG